MVFRLLISYTGVFMAEMNEIIPGVFQGSHPRILPDYVEAVLNVDWTGNRYDTSKLKGYTHKPIFDGPDPGPEWLDEALKVLAEYRQNGWKVYIHCQAGMSRSVFVTAALLVRELGITPSEAIKMIDSKSRFADPAPAFRLALESFYQRESAVVT